MDGAGSQWRKDSFQKAPGHLNNSISRKRSERSANKGKRARRKKNEKEINGCC